MRRAAVVAAAGAVILIGSQAATGNPSQPGPGIIYERNGDLFVIGIDGTRTTRLTATRTVDERSPTVSPDGRWIAYTRPWRGASTIWIRRTDGKAVRRLTSGDDFAPDWASDGRTIYFTRTLVQEYTGGSLDLHEYCGSVFRVGADGRGAKRLTNAPWKDSFHHHGAPSVSPDGTRIAFTDMDQCSGGTTSFALRVVDAAGRPVDDLSRLPGNAYVWQPGGREYGAPDWSPDGDRLAFTNGTLYTARRDGSGLRRVTPSYMRAGTSWGAGPAWSPDGDWIAFEGSVGGGAFDLYVIRPDGTGLRRLTRTAADELSPAWIAGFPAG